MKPIRFSSCSLSKNGLVRQKELALYALTENVQEFSWFKVSTNLLQIRLVLLHNNRILSLLVSLILFWEVVVAQLAERSPTIPEDPGSNPVIGNFYLNIYLLLTVCRKDENKEKKAENGPFLKKVGSWRTAVGSGTTNPRFESRASRPYQHRSLPRAKMYHFWFIDAWSSLVEGDEQPDQLNCQTCVECGYVHAATFF